MLSDTMWFEIMLHLNAKDIKKLCNNPSIDQNYNNMINHICADEHFWKVKMEKDFGNFPKLEGKTWYQCYKAMATATENLNIDIGIQLIFTMNIGQKPDNITMDDITLPTPYSENAPIEYKIFKAKEYMLIVNKITVHKARSVDESDLTLRRKLHHIILTNDQVLWLLYILYGYGHDPEHINRFNFHTSGAKYS